MKILSASDIVKLLHPTALVASIERAVRAYSAGETMAPVRQHVEWDANVLLIMPAIAGKSLGVKLVTVTPGNSKRGIPVTNGLMVLSDAETGMPLVILNGAALTAQRTGAVGAFAATYITPPDLTSVGIIGAGVQGSWQAIFACAVRPIDTVYFVDRSDDSARRFIETVAAHTRNVVIQRCADAHNLLNRTTWIVTATTSSEPVLPNDLELLRNKHFISVGSFRPSMQEWPDAVPRLAKQIVIDSEAARHEVGDVARPIARELVSNEDVFHLSELVSGNRTLDVTQTTAFKSVGMAIYDLFAATAMYEEASRSKAGQEIDL